MDDDDRPDEGDDAGEPIGDQWADAITIDDTGGWQLTDAEIALLTDEDRAAYLAELEEYEAALERTAPFKWELVDNPKQMLAHFLAPKVDTLFYGGAAGGGKGSVLDAGQIRYHAHMGQPLTADRDVHVCTPFGFKLFRDVKIGDQISNPDGTVQRVIALHELGDREIFRVSFVDGATTLVTGDHLWLVNLSGKRLKAERRYPTDEGWTGKNSSVIMTTEALKAHLEKCEAGPDTARPHWPLIPLTEPVEFLRAWRNADFSRPIPPYLLGVLIGDGYLGGKGQPSFYSADPEIAERVRSLGDNLTFTQRPGKEDEQGSYRLSDFGVTKEQLSRLDLLCGASEKHLPKDYLEAPLAIRWELARGLFDTDGTADARGHVSYTTISQRLIEDVAWLVRSLGFKATITDRIPTYTLHGEKMEGQRAYTAYVQGDRCAELFHLERKRERCKAGVNGGDRAKRRMVKIESIGFAAARCITVDNPNGLYITDDFIVTHNSEFLCWHAHELSLRYPGHHSLLLRTKLPELRRSLIRRMETRFVQLGIRRTVKLRRLDNLTAFYYPNGSIIEFGFCASDDDVSQFLSAEYDMIGFDEGTKFSPYSIQMISSRARTDRRKSRMGVRPHVILCSNPGGRAHTYLKKLIIGPSERGASVAIYDAAAGVSVENVLEGETRLIEQLPMPTVETVEAFDDGHVPGGDRLSVAFIQAFHRDNPHLDKGYVGRLRALPDTERRQQELGDWDAFDGKAFPDFDWETHVVDYFDPPAHWRRATGADYGWGAPAVNLWGAWDQDGVCWIYRESKLIRHTAPEQGRIWKELSVDPEGRREHIEMRLADRSTHASNGIGAPVAVQWRNGGWQTQPADNARIPGWANVHAYLEITERQPEPKLRIMRSCPYLIETLATIQADPKKPEDVDTDADDHACVHPSTLVWTDTGDRRIDEIVAGDMVMTRDGFRRVLWAGPTGVRPIVRVERKGHRSLFCTADHPIATGSTWSTPTELSTRSGTLVECLIPRSSPQPPSVSTGSPTTSAATTSSATGCGSIARSGLWRTGPSPQATTFTTATRTATTTVSRTSNSSSAATTSPSTPRSRRRRASRRVLRRFLAWWPATRSSPPPSGATQRSVGGRTLPSTPSPASTAAASSNRGAPADPSTATSTARCRSFEPVVVRPMPGVHEVWNLVVEGTPEFVAEGIVVHNCDALRYMLQFRPIRMKRRTAEIIDDGLDDISRRVQTKVARLLRSKNRRG